MNSWTFFANLYTAFDAVFIGAVQKGINNIAAEFQAPLVSAVTLWLAGMVSMEIMTPSGEPMLALLRKLARVALVVSALATATYSQIFGTFLLTTLPNELVGVISGALPGASLAPAAFDKFLGATWAGAVEVWKSIHGWGPQSFGTMIVVGLDVTFSAVAIGIAFLIFMAQHVLLGVTIEVGPAFIFMLLWTYTARFFGGWIGVVAALITMEVLLVALLSILINVDTDIVQQIAALDGNGANAFNASDEFGQLHLLIEGMILSASMGFFAGVLPFVAQAIAGGVAAQVAPLTQAVSGFASSVGQVAAPVGGRIGSAAKGLGSMASAGMRSLRPAARAA